MQVDRVLHARFNSVGYPASRKYTQGTPKQIGIELIIWLMQVTVNNRVEVVIAATRELLEGKIVKSRPDDNEDLRHELREMFAGIGDEAIGITSDQDTNQTTTTQPNLLPPTEETMGTGFDRASHIKFKG